jgi:PIN domain nuclease of toxin-antitoxin system
VVAKLADAGMPGVDIRRALDPLGLDVRQFDAASAYASGLLRPETRSAGLSLGDRACLALARRLDAPSSPPNARGSGSMSAWMSCWCDDGRIEN